jgi:hypothetical protein
MSQPMVIVNPEFDYTPHARASSTPFQLSVPPVSSQPEVVIDQSAVQGPIQFLLSSRVFNLAKSSLRFGVEIPAQGGTNHAWLNGNLSSIISRITIYSQQTGTILCDTSNLDRVAGTITPLLKKDDELFSTASSPYTTSTTAVPTLYTSEVLARRNVVSCLNMSNALVNPTTSAQQTDYTGAYTGRRQSFVSTTGSGSGPADVAHYIYCDLLLSDLLPFSVASIDKMLWFGGENLLVDVYFNAGNRFCWVAPSATNPIASGATAYSDTILITYPTIQLQCEQDASAIAQITTAVREAGIELPMPYLFVNKAALSGDSQNYSTQITRAMGSSLQAIFYALYNSSEQNATAQDHSFASMFGGSTGVVYQSQLDNQPVRNPAGFNVMNSDQYVLNKDFIKGSCVKTFPMFQIDSAHIDSWVGRLVDYDPCARQGVSLVDNRTISWELNGASLPACRLYMMIVAQKTLLMSGAGLRLIS